MYKILLERLGRALFCGGRWSQRTAKHKTWLTRRGILIFSAAVGEAITLE